MSAKAAGGPEPSEWRAWARKIGPWLIAAGAVAFVARRVSPVEIAVQMRQGNALAMLPLGIGLMFALLALVAVWDFLVVRPVLGKLGPLDVLRGRGGAALLAIFHYGAFHGGYGVWLARTTGAGVRKTAGVVLYLVASDLSGVCIAGAIAAPLAGDLAPSWLRIVAPAIAAAVVVAVLAGPALLGRLASPPAALEAWRLVPRGAAVAQIAGRGLNIGLAVVVTWAGAHVFGLAIPLGAMAAYIPVIMVVQSLPGSVGGMGAGQIVWLTAFHPFASDARILAFQMLWHLTNGLGLVLRGLPFVRRVVAEIDAGRADAATVDPAGARAA